MFAASSSVGFGHQESQSLSGNISALFAEIKGQMRIGFLGRNICENFLNNKRLRKTRGGDVNGSWWGVWEGENSTGHISFFASYPDAMDRTKDKFWVVFSLPDEKPMPEALLAHFLSKAKETRIASGDTVEIRFPYEQQLGGCMEGSSITVRMTNGALVSNTAEESCTAR